MWCQSLRRSVVVGLAATALALSMGCDKDGGGGGPAGPSATTTSVTVGFPAGGTIFIGRDVQFEARETLSNGTTRVATNATWGSDAPAVASVSAAGLVRGVAAGEATIFADAGVRGVLRIRVYPNFGGAWRGSEVLITCEESGALVGICAAVRVGETGTHDSSFTQTDASVSAVLDPGDGSTARMTGTISVGGELTLPSAAYLPADPDVNVQAQNWRSRSDVPSQMTGTYELLFTLPGVAGSARFGVRLQDVVRTSGPSAQTVSPAGTALIERLKRRFQASR